MPNTNSHHQTLLYLFVPCSCGDYRIHHVLRQVPCLFVGVHTHGVGAAADFFRVSWAASVAPGGISVLEGRALGAAPALLDFVQRGDGHASNVSRLVTTTALERRALGLSCNYIWCFITSAR